MASITELKSTLRSQMLERREAMEEKAVCRKSREIAESLYVLEEYLNSQTVFIYLSKGNEVRTDAMVERALREGKNVFAPAVDRNADGLRIAPIKNLDRDLVSGAFGVREPADHSQLMDARGVLDLALVPGIAFDVKGGRLGFGKGYFDRFLKGLNGLPILGLAYDFQVIEELPQSPWDMPVHKIITEKKTIDCRARSPAEPSTFNI